MWRGLCSQMTRGSSLVFPIKNKNPKHDIKLTTLVMNLTVAVRILIQRDLFNTLNLTRGPRLPVRSLLPLE